MASNDLAELFTRLPTSGSRLDALEALIKELTPYEWRFVQSLTSTRSFQFDIIGQLPVELVSCIFSYLDTSTPWRLQLVSCLWAKKLRSLVVLKTSLDSWYDGTVKLQHADLDFCRRKARSVHAFRCPSRSALPDSSFKITTPPGLTHRLTGDNLIWIDRDRRQVRILDMRSWTSRVLTSVARELVYNIHVSDEIVAFTVLNGTVYVTNLNGQGLVKKFRFPRSTQRLPVTCRRRTVACAEILKDGILIYIWNFDTQQGRSFVVNNETQVCSGHQLDSLKAFQMSLLLQPDTATIVLFLIDYPTSENLLNCPQVRFYRLTYTGKCLNGTTQALEQYGNFVIESGDSSGMSLIPASHDGLFMVRQDEAKNFVRSAYTLYFDEKLHSFVSYKHPRLHPVNSHDQGNVVWWKDTFVEAGTKERIVIHRGITSTPHLDPKVAYDHREPGEAEPEDSRNLLVNDRYIVRPYCNAIYVYCYDHTVQLPGKEGMLDGVGPWKAIEPEFASARECVESMHNI